MKRIMLFSSFILVIALTACSNSVQNVTKVKMEEEPIVTVTSADYPSYDTQDSIQEKADIIVSGKIKDVRTEYIDILMSTSDTGDDSSEEKMLYNIYTLKVTEVYKGDIKKNDMLEFKVLVAIEGDETQRISDQPKFGKEKDFILFLEEYEGVPASLLNNIESFYEVTESGIKKDGRNSIDLDIEKLKTTK